MELIARVMERTSSVIFQPLKAMLIKGVKNIINMPARELEAVGDARFVPAFLGHAHYGPPGFVAITKTRKGAQVEFELQRGLVGRKKPLQGVMVGVIAEFASQDALDLTQMNGGIALF